MQWKSKLTELIDHLAARMPPHVRGAQAHLDANSEMIGRALAGFGPDNQQRPGCGVRVVVNMASIHIPAFVKGRGAAYQNSYDRGKDVRLEQVPAGSEIPVRISIDHALEVATGIPQQRIYFAAAELNGPGIRFYGDICLVLGGLTDDATPVVETNSYDALRPPRTARGTAADQGTVDAEVGAMTGRWGDDFINIATIKVLAHSGDTDRLLTTGQISDALLHDEVYVEILLMQSFDVSAVEEARSSVGDTTLENQIAELGRVGPTPMAAEHEWRNQRRAARRALAAQRKSLRTVAISGRVKG